MKLQIKKLEILYYLGSEQQMRWLECADAQAELCLCCSHMVLNRFSHDVAHFVFNNLRKKLALVISRTF